MGRVSQPGTLSGRRTTAVLIALLSSAIPAYADGLDQVRDFNIEEQALDSALIEFSEQAGVQLMVPTELVADLRSPSIAGRYATDKALLVLLDGSELTFQAIGDDTVTLQAADQGGDSDSKNSSPASILMAQSTSSQIQTTASSRRNEGGSSVVTGRVTDARTGVNLKGAKVTIEETGQWTRTNNLGEFRFPAAAIGEYTLRVSFLGYEEASATILVSREGERIDLQMASTFDEIVVLGTRSARMQALNQERTSDNFTSVLSSDQLGQFSGTTISEALRRAPGIAFEQDPETGEGSNVIVRGLEPDFNQVTINGVRLAEGSGVGRSPNLSSILTESIESVTINKTLLPSQDATGTGALIEVETLSPLDRDRRFASLGYEYNERGDGFGQDRLLSGTLSGVFGQDDDWGGSISVQYRDTNTNNVGHDLSLVFGQYLPAGISNDGQIDPITAFPFEVGVDEAYPVASQTFSAERKSENLSFTGTVERQLGSHTNFRFDYTRTDVTTDALTRELLVDPVDGLIPIGIDELAGEQRTAFVTELPPGGFLSGVIVNNTQTVTYRPDRSSKSDTASFRGTTELDRWDYSYSLGYSKSETESELFRFSIAQDFSTVLTPLSAEEIGASVASNTESDLIVSVYEPIRPGSAPGLVFPNLTQAYFDRVNDVANYRLQGGGSGQVNVGGTFGENTRWSFGGSARRTFLGGVLEYAELGIFGEESRYENTPKVINGQRERYFFNEDTPISDIGLEFGPGILDIAGNDTGGFDILTQQSVVSFQQSLDALVQSGVLREGFLELRPTIFDQSTRESEIAGYFESKVVLGRAEVIGGFRLVSVEVKADIDSSPTLILSDGTLDDSFNVQFSQIVSQKERQTDFLPRFLVNYRFSEDLIARGGYFATVARPRVLNLSAAQRVTLDLQTIYGRNGNQPRLSVAQGNPGLSPSYTHNIDGSIEYYTDDVGAIKFSVFYKEIEDPLQFVATEGGIELSANDIDLPDVPEFSSLPDNVFVEVTQPVNSDDRARLWGAEFSIERRFDFLPGWWGGFGAFGNVTYADSEQTVVFSTQSDDDGFVELKAQLPGSPKYSGTAALTYEKYGFDSSLVYTWQDRRLVSVEDFGLDSFESEVDTLDLRIAYNDRALDKEYTVFFEANDLLRGTDDAFVQREVGGVRGAPTYSGENSQFFGGRNFVVGARVNF